MLTILIGLIPAAIIRWLILRKPTSIGVAVGVCFVIFIAVLFSLEAMQLTSNTLPGPIAVCSFFILRWGASEPRNKDSAMP
jgi:hypothetical protein